MAEASAEWRMRRAGSKSLGILWDFVMIPAGDNGEGPNHRFKCCLCGMELGMRSSTLMAEHFLDSRGKTACTADGHVLDQVRTKLSKEREDKASGKLKKNEVATRFQSTLSSIASDAKNRTIESVTVKGQAATAVSAMATCIFALGLPVSIVEKPAFRTMINAVISGARQGEVLSNRCFSRDAIVAQINPVQEAIEARIKKVLSPSARLFGFELSVDGYSSKGAPKHNKIVSTPGGQILLDVEDSSGVSPNAAYIGDVVIRGLKKAVELFHSDEPRPSQVRDFTTIEDIAEGPSTVRTEAAERLAHESDPASSKSHDDLAGFDAVAQKFVWVTMDGARVNLSSMPRVLEVFPETLYGTCLSHSFNLVLKDISSLSFSAPVLSGLRLIHQVFRNQDIPHNLFKKFSDKEILQFPLTRFGYFVIALRRLVDLKECLQMTVGCDEFVEYSRNVKPAEKRALLQKVKKLIVGEGEFTMFWNDALLLLSVMTPFLRLVREADRAIPGFICFAHFLFIKASNAALSALKLEGIRQEQSERANGLSMQVRSILEKRKDYSFNDLHLMARWFNPALFDENEAFFKQARHIVDRVIAAKFPKYETSFKVDLISFCSRLSSLPWDGAKRIPPHMWWQVAAGSLPFLASFACRLTSATGVASITERNWSALDIILQKRRMRTTEENSSKLVYAFFNLPMLDREIPQVPIQEWKDMYTEAEDEDEPELAKSKDWATQQLQIDEANEEVGLISVEAELCPIDYDERSESDATVDTAADTSFLISESSGKRSRPASS